MAELHISNRNMVWGRILGAVIAIPFGVAVPLAVLTSGEGLSDYIFAPIGPIIILTYGWMVIGIVFSMALGEQITVRTLFGTKVHPWDELRQVSFSAQATALEGLIPIAPHMFLHTFFASGKTYQVKVNRETAQEVVRLLEERGCLDLVQPLIPPDEEGAEWQQ